MPGRAGSTNSHYPLTFPGSGDLDVTRGSLTIVGTLPSTIFVNASGLGDRVFQVMPGAQPTLSNIGIQGGSTNLVSMSEGDPAAGGRL